MPIELDHVFVCANVGAPEGERLVDLRFQEGSPNTHPGQGTANRRFFFSDTMIELLWVSDAEEAQRQPAYRTQLWQRWSERRMGASPFGIIARPVDPTAPLDKFPGWEYRPDWLPKGLVVHVGDAAVEEPMWVYMDFLTRPQRQVTHPNGSRDITGIALETPVPLASPAAQLFLQNQVLALQRGAEHLLIIELDHGLRGQSADLRPDLPLVLRY